MKKTLLVLLITLPFLLSAQTDTTTVKNKKKGFSFGALPAIAYDSDLGFRYGAIVNIFHYGDGSRYPKYDHSVYMEWSKTTKGSMLSNFIYDTETLIPKTRLTFETSYLTEQTLDFMGFNGYQSTYKRDFTDQTNPNYISRAFYKQDLKRLRIKADFQGNILGHKLRWLAGLAHYGSKIESVDRAKLNKGQKTENLLPDTATLFDIYKQYNVLQAGQFNGGNTQLLKAGLVWDTRNNEANPDNGIWTEALVIATPSFMGNKYSYTAAMISHRQYFTLWKNYLTFAYRLRYQTKLSGDIPFYMLPYVFNSKQTEFGLGGKKTLRGILRNRVVGDGVALGNFELRGKILNTILFKQNFYIALSAFADAGIVTKEYEINTSQIPAEYKYLFNTQPDKLHISYGAGLHFALNENFIVAVDYGLALKKEDGKSGLYIGLNFLF